MTHDTLVLPAESRVREFDAKLLLACHAARAGLRVLVGAKKTLDALADRWPPAVYVGKSVTDRNLRLYDLVRDLGHVVTAWDEEGLVYASAQVYRATKVGLAALNRPQCLFAWGEANAAVWRETPGFRGTPIHATGNPRADLLRPELRGYFEAEIRAIEARHGPFVLVNTNFSRLNHYYPALSRQRRLLEDGGGALTGPDDPRLGLAAHKQALLAHFRALVPALAARIAPARLVIRPHPSEHEALWREAGAGHANVVVDRSGPVVPWLLAARATVHNGCTTAVESYLLGRIAVAWQPVRSDTYDHPLPNALSVQTATLEETLEVVAGMLAGGAACGEAERAARLELARAHVASVDGPSACERIVAALRPVTQAPAAPRRGRRVWGRCRAVGRRLERSVQAVRPGHRNNRAYLDHMFPPIGVPEVVAAIARFDALIGGFGRLRVIEHAPSVFLIEAA